MVCELVCAPVIASCPVTLGDHCSAGGPRPQSEDVSNLLLGLLVVQDIQLGGVVALLPLLAPQTSPGASTSWSRVAGLVRTMAGVGVLLVLARVCFSPHMERCFRWVSHCGGLNW